MINYLKYAVALLVVTSVIGGVTYTLKLQSDLATVKSNNEKLTQSVQEQHKQIIKQAAEVAEIQLANNQLNETRVKLQADVDRLNTVFRVSARGKSRDFGDITRAKPALVNKIVNRASNNVNRCFELAMGATLEDGEKNNECKNLINSIK